MARQPAFREEIVLNPCTGGPRERILIIDLCTYLCANRVGLTRIAKKLGVWHPPEVQRGRPWTTPYGAKRLIAYMRALHQSKYERGQRPFEEAADARAWKAKKLAKSGAGTDAEPQLRGQLKGGG
jgi:hypothetical protein